MVLATGATVRSIVRRRGVAQVDTRAEADLFVCLLAGLYAIPAALELQLALWL